MKRLLCIIICASIAALSAGQCSALGTLSGSRVSFKDGYEVKCGKYLVTAAVNTKTSKVKYYRTDLNGKKAALIAASKSFSGVPLAEYDGAVYYRKAQKIYSYDPESDASELFFSRAKDEKFAMLGICPSGIILSDSKNNIILRRFDGSESEIVKNSKSKAGGRYNFLGATDEYIFTFRAEKKSAGRYLCRVFRYSPEDETSEKTSEFKTVSKPGALPSAGSFHTFKTKLLFTAGATSSKGVYKGAVYSMNTDGSGAKTLKENVTETLTPGDNHVFLISTDSRDNFIINKITPKGKVKTAVKYGDENIPVITYTTETDRALAIKTGSDYYYFDTYALSGVKKQAGKKLISAKSVAEPSDVGNLYIGAHIYDSVGDVVSLSYSVYCYDHNGNYVKTARCKTYLVNVKTGKKTLFD